MGLLLLLVWLIFLIPHSLLVFDSGLDPNNFHFVKVVSKVAILSVVVLL